MPEYTFICDKKNKTNSGCGHVFALIMSYVEYKDKQTCPKCKEANSVRRYYELDLPGTRSTIRQSNTEITIGHLAQRNSERMSNDEKTHLIYEQNKYKFEEPTKDLPKGMNRMGNPKDRVINQKQRKKDPKRYSKRK